MTGLPGPGTLLCLKLPLSLQLLGTGFMRVSPVQGMGISELLTPALPAGSAQGVKEELAQADPLASPPLTPPRTPFPVSSPESDRKSTRLNSSH